MNTNQNRLASQSIDYDLYRTQSFFEILDASGNVVEYGDLVEATDTNNARTEPETEAQD